MIQLRGVKKRFGSQIVLDGVDFDVQEGETVALMGPSGTGKSVLLKHIIGLIKPDAGTVVVDEKEVAQLKRGELAELRSHIGYVFQNGALFDSMDVFENIRLGISDEDRYNDLSYVRERVKQCLGLVNLQPDVALKYPAELSGGMRKRVGIARAIAGEPPRGWYRGSLRVGRILTVRRSPDRLAGVAATRVPAESGAGTRWPSSDTPPRAGRRPPT